MKTIKLLLVSLFALFCIAIQAQNTTQTKKIKVKEIVFEVKFNVNLPHTSKNLEQTLSNILFGYKETLNESFKYFSKQYDQPRYDEKVRKYINIYVKEIYHNPNTGLLCIEYTSPIESKLLDISLPKYLSYDIKNDRMIELKDLITTDLQTHIIEQGFNIENANNIYSNGQKYMCNISGTEIKMSPSTLYKKMSDYGLEMVGLERSALENINNYSEDENRNEILELAEQMPSFPGGEDAMKKWIEKNIKYPDCVRHLGVFGNVLVSVVIEQDGSISNAKILKSIDNNGVIALDEKKQEDLKIIEEAKNDINNEALRLINNMPDWIPGLNNGHYVRVQITIPITFVLVD